MEKEIKRKAGFHISPYLHSTFGEILGTLIYDGTWVGKDSPIPNVNGIRKDVIDGMKECGITAIRWPGGCAADHYHWKDGTWVGKDSPIPNVNGIRKDVIDGMKECGITAIRWPGGCAADHYHWKDGIGKERKRRFQNGDYACFKGCAANRARFE